MTTTERAFASERAQKFNDDRDIEEARILGSWRY